jgi:hypothetical protein
LEDQMTDETKNDGGPEPVAWQGVTRSGEVLMTRSKGVAEGWGDEVIVRPLYASPLPTDQGGYWSDDKTYEEAPLPTVEVTATHRHKKRGTEYVLIGIGKIQSQWWYEPSFPIGEPISVDMREVAIYRSITDPTEISVRPREEFEDGRFEALSQNKGE